MNPKPPTTPPPVSRHIREERTRTAPPSAPLTAPSVPESLSNILDSGVFFNVTLPEKKVWNQLPAIGVIVELFLVICLKDVIGGNFNCLCGLIAESPIIKYIYWILFISLITTVSEAIAIAAFMFAIVTIGSCGGPLQWILVLLAIVHMVLIHMRTSSLVFNDVDLFFFVMYGAIIYGFTRKWDSSSTTCCKQDYTLSHMPGQIFSIQNPSIGPF